MKILLSVVAGPNKGQKFSFERHDTFIVGRGATAHLRLPPKDKYFSRNHFLLELNPPLCRLTNLSKTNGTFVNGQRVASTDLMHGDVIVAGDTAIRVRFVQPKTPMQGPGSEPVAIPRTIQEHLGSVLGNAPKPESEGTEREPQPTESELSIPRTVDFMPQPVPEDSSPEGEDLPPRRDRSDRPERFGPYQIIRELGRGGMGIVYLARHLTTGMLIAVKAIKPSGPAEDVEIERFLREASILRKLRHEHIVWYHACGHESDHVYFGMEYIEGADAHQLLKREGRIAIGRAVRWACQLLEALEHAHGRGFVHRDIKPPNLLIAQTPDGECLKLADFGLARVYQSSTISGLTMVGDIGGSVPFMPPEQITSFRDVDPKCDIYSTGATLYTLLTGEFVYDLPKKSVDRMLMVLQNAPVDIGLRCAAIPEPLKRIVHRALERNPADRFASAAEMRQALLPFAT